jgi:rubrerythrin
MKTERNGKFVIRALTLDSIRIDGGTQPRCEIDTALVTEYAGDIEAGAELPPVVVFQDGTDTWLADGFHRYHATNTAGKDRIAAECHPGTLRDAILWSVGANASHGKRRTNADKRKAVETLLALDGWSDKPNREVARQCRVDEGTVRKYRSELSAEIPQIQESDTRTVTRNGTTYTMDVTGQKEAAKARTAEPSQPIEPAKPEYMVVESQPLDPKAPMYRCTVCDDLFDRGDLWHCPVCAHHYTVDGEPKCGNCHRAKAPKKPTMEAMDFTVKEWVDAERAKIEAAQPRDMAAMIDSEERKQADEGQIDFPADVYPSEEEEAPPATEAMKDAAGRQVPPNLTEVFALRSKFRGLIQTLGAVETTIRELLASPAGHYLDTRTIAEVKTIQNAVKYATPYVVCKHCNAIGCVRCYQTGFMGETSISRSEAKQ